MDQGRGHDLIDITAPAHYPFRRYHIMDSVYMDGVVVDVLVDDSLIDPGDPGDITH
jgi:hypothetical protein